MIEYTTNFDFSLKIPILPPFLACLLFSLPPGPVMGFGIMIFLIPIVSPSTPPRVFLRPHRAFKCYVPGLSQILVDLTDILGKTLLTRQAIYDICRFAVNMLFDVECA